MAGRLGGFGDAAGRWSSSGINPGHNTGRAMLHSGTVGAALTAANFGCSGAGRQHRRGRRPTTGRRRPPGGRGGRVARRRSRRRRCSTSTCPTVPLDEVRGVRWAELAPFGTVRATLVEPRRRGLQMELRETRRRAPARQRHRAGDGRLRRRHLAHRHPGRASREPVAEAIERRRRADRVGGRRRRRSA